MPYGLVLTDFGPDSKLRTGKSENLEISKFEKDARRKMIEICLVKTASTSVALRNWALRLWEEINKSFFFRLSVSYDRISSQLRGVYVQPFLC